MLTKTQEQVSRQAKGPEESLRPALALAASKSCRKLPSIFGTMLMIHSGRGLWIGKLSRYIVLLHWCLPAAKCNTNSEISASKKKKKTGSLTKNSPVFLQ